MVVNRWALSPLFVGWIGSTFSGLCLCWRSGISQLRSLSGQIFVWRVILHRTSPKTIYRFYMVLWWRKAEKPRAVWGSCWGKSNETQVIPIVSEVFVVACVHCWFRTLNFSVNSDFPARGLARSRFSLQRITTKGWKIGIYNLSDMTGQPMTRRWSYSMICHWYCTQQCPIIPNYCTVIDHCHIVYDLEICTLILPAIYDVLLMPHVIWQFLLHGF